MFKYRKRIVYNIESGRMNLNILKPGKLVEDAFTTPNVKLGFGLIVVASLINFVALFGPTFDLGNVPSNDQEICCEIGDWFSNSKFNIIRSIKG